MTPPATPRSLDRLVFLLLAIALAAGGAACLVGFLPGHLLNATRFLLYDQGSYLYAVDCWRAGERLYRDFAWQYGPLALGWYRGFAAMGGNNPLTLVVAGSLAFAGGWALVADLLVREAGRVAGGLMALVLLPVMVASGPFLINGPHGAIEMLLLAAIASTLSARAPGSAQAWLLGGLVGLLQWVRFGPQAAALVLVLLLAAWQMRGSAGTGWRGAWVGFAGRVLAGYAIIWLPLALWYVRALPAPGAWEQLWPVFMTAHYAETYRDRWPEVGSVLVFLQQWLPAVIGVGLALAGLVRGFRRTSTLPRQRSDQPAPAGLLFLPLYYLVGALVLFRNANTLGGNLWLAWPGLVLLMSVVGRVELRWLLVTALLPAAIAPWLSLAGLHRAEQAWRAQPVALPNGQQLWFHGDELPRFARLGQALEAIPPPRRVGVMLAGGGLHHFFGLARAGRHWWFLPEFVRPWEEREALDALKQHQALFIANMGQPDAAAPEGTVVLRLPVSPELRGALVPSLVNPERIGDLGVLVRLQR